MRQVLDFLKFVAEEKNYKMMQAGARMGSEVSSSLIDDLHNIGRIVSSAKEGAGVALLKSMFPKATETAQKNIKRINTLEEELFPRLPEDGNFYTANVVKGIVDEEGAGIYCMINSRPQIYFTIHTDAFRGKKIPETVIVRCVEQKDGAYTLANEPVNDVIYTF